MQTDIYSWGLVMYAHVLKALEKKPEQRQRSMKEVTGALRAEPEARPRRRGLQAAAVAVLALLGGVVWLLSSGRPSSPSRPESSSVKNEVHAKAESGALAEPSDAEINDSLKVADFFLNKGDYESAIAELKQASARAPNNTKVRAALDSARQAQAAEEAVLRAGK